MLYYSVSYATANSHVHPSTVGVAMVALDTHTLRKSV